MFFIPAPVIAALTFPGVIIHEAATYFSASFSSCRFLMFVFFAWEIRPLHDKN
jgi:hypothetical protein